MENHQLKLDVAANNLKALVDPYLKINNLISDLVTKPSAQAVDNQKLLKKVKDYFHQDQYNPNYYMGTSRFYGVDYTETCYKSWNSYVGDLDLVMLDEFIGIASDQFDTLNLSFDQIVAIFKQEFFSLLRFCDDDMHQQIIDGGDVELVLTEI